MSTRYTAPHSAPAAARRWQIGDRCYTPEGTGFGNRCPGNIIALDPECRFASVKMDRGGVRQYRTADLLPFTSANRAHPDRSKRHLLPMIDATKRLDRQANRYGRTGRSGYGSRSLGRRAA